MLKITRWQLWCALALLSLSTAKLMAAVDFNITEHSQTQFSLYKGDKLHLEVRLSSEESLDTNVKWLTSGKILCRSLVCEVDTSRFPEGYTIVYAVLFNDRDSRSIRFSFNILQPPAGRQTYTVSPPLVPYAGRDDNGPDQTTTLGALKGSIYRYTAQSLDVIRNRSTSILWNEKVRAGKNALGWARWKNSDEHFFFNEASVFLNRFESGERFLVLESGALRSRVLQGHSQEHSQEIVILPHPEVQVTLGENADVLVVRKTGQVIVHGLRGLSYIELKADKNQRHTLLVGTSLEIDLKTFAIRLVPPDVDLLERAVSEGSPELVGLERVSLLRDTMPLGEKDVELNVADLFSKGDYVLALQHLQKQKKKQGQNFDQWLSLARAYQSLGLKKSALALVQQHEKSFHARAEGMLLAGVIAVENGDFTRGRDFLEEASIFFPESVNLDYYKGIAHARLGDRFSANYHLRDALWNSSDLAVQASARAHLKRIEHDTWLFMHIASGVFFKTNIVGLKSGDAASPLPSRDSGFGTYASYDFRLNLLNTDPFALDFSYLGFGSRYIFEEQSIANVQKHKIALALLLRPGHGAEDQAWISLKFQPFVEANLVGNQRALDRMGGEVVLASPRLPLQPRLGMETTKNIDPLPLNNDAFSPMSGYYEGRFDQSHQGTRYILGLALFESDTIGHLNSELAMGKRSFDDKREHNETTIDFVYRYPLNLRLVFGVDLGYSALEAVAVDKSKQKDQGLKLKLLQSLDVNPLISFDFSQGATLRKSSESSRDYNAQEYSLGARLNF